MSLTGGAAAVAIVASPIGVQRADKCVDKAGDFVSCGVEGEMACVENVHVGGRHVASLGLRLGRLERQVVFAPEDEKPRLLLAHPGLPLGVGRDIRAIVVEEVALNTAWPG